MANFGKRIVVLIDMDCFYCQVETRLQPEFTGKPLAVVQYNQWKLGGIIAVNYEARAFGVTRYMRGEEARVKCPELLLASVPCLRGKADTSKYRSAGREVIDVLKKTCNMIERASVDEAYLDITEIVDEKLSKRTFNCEDITVLLKTTYIVGYSQCGVNNEEERCKGLQTWLSKSSTDIQVQRLLIAGAFIEDLRKEIFETTGFKCSAGISFNKILAKLACGLHKPNCQTILSSSAVPQLFSTLPVKKVRNLGGKLGDIVIDSLQCNVMSDLLRYSLNYLQNRFDEKIGLRLYNVARGIDNEPVTPRLVSKSIGACKNFPGKLAIINKDVLEHWLSELSSEVCERLEQDMEENERKASLLTVSFHYYQNKSSVSQSRSSTLSSYKPEKITQQCLNMVLKGTQQQPISFLGISASKFVAKGSDKFINFFKSSKTDKLTSTSNNDNETISDSKSKESDINDKDTIINSKQKVNDNLIKETINVKKPESSSTKIDVKQTLSPCSSIKHSLKSDNFTKSFFMNILNEEKSKRDILNTISQKHESCMTYDYSIASNETLHSIDDEFDYSPQTTCKKSTHKVKNDSCLNSNNKLSVAIQEIFPNINDVDPNIVRLLPPDMQQEVKNWLKSSNVHCNNIIENKLVTKEVGKNGKGKFSKSKPLKKIEDFIIKTNMNNDLNNYKKCPECDQLIEIQKFNEHTDYHVAQVVQKEINQIFDNGDVRKKKIIMNDSNHLKKRVNGEIVSNKTKKNRL